MSENLITDVTARKNAVKCFNMTWDLIDKKIRNADDKRNMICLAHASLWFWQLVQDHTKTNLSVGYWQISRVYSILGDGNMAVLFAEKCIEESKDASVDPFYLAYGLEALARGWLLCNDAVSAVANLEKAKNAVVGTKEKNLEALIKDLDELRRLTST